MECSCIRGSGKKFDFLLDIIDCTNIVFTDLSNWMDEEYYIIPEEYPMTVTLPNGNTTSVNFVPQGRTSLTSQNLSTSETLPDGVYCFSTTSCGETYTRYSAVACLLECGLDMLTAQANTKEDFDKIFEIKNYIESMKVNARMGKPQKATKFYQIAKKELDNLNCNCNA